MFLRLGLSFVVAGAILISMLGRAGASASFDAAEAAYIAGRLDEARAAYAAAGTGAASAKDRAASLRQLGIIAWRIDGDHEMAERRFAEALRVGVERARTHVERARFYATVGRFADAIAAGHAAVATATNSPERNRAALGLARAATLALQGTTVAAQTRVAEAHLARARDAIMRLAQVPPLSLNLSDALLTIALRLDDGQLALLAWRSYAREGVDEGAWAPAGRKLGAALPAWRRGALNPALRREVFDALVTSHFFELAVMIAQDDRIEGRDAFVREQRVADVIAYTAMMSDMRKLTEDYYRELASRKAVPDAWRTSLLKRAQQAWATFGLTARDLSFRRKPSLPTSSGASAPM